MTTATAAAATRSTCRACHGAGEFGTHQDYFGNWNTEPCHDCRGTGETEDRCSHCAEPTLADELVALDGQDVCLPCVTALTGDDPYSPDNARDLGSATTATVLLGLIFGGLLWLAALAYGQHLMCAVHDQTLRYCPGYSTGATNLEETP